MVNPDVQSKEKPSILELVIRLKEIQLGLKLNVARLHEDLAMLEDEAGLQSNLEIARKDAEDRAHSLALEVEHLREELKDLKKLLGENVRDSAPNNL